MRLRLRDLIISADPEPVILVCALVAFVFGGVLLIPGSTFSISPSYVTIGKIISEDLAGAIFAALGLAGFAGLLIAHFDLLRLVCMAYVVVFLSLAASFVISVPLSTGAIYSVFAVAAAWAFWRLGAK